MFYVASGTAESLPRGSFRKPTNQKRVGLKDTGAKKACFKRRPNWGAENQKLWITEQQMTIRAVKYTWSNILDQATTLLLMYLFILNEAPVTI